MKYIKSINEHNEHNEHLSEIKDLLSIMSDDDLIRFNKDLKIRYTRHWNIISILRKMVIFRTESSHDNTVINLEYKQIRLEFLLIIKGELYNFLNEEQKERFNKKITSKRFNL